MNNFERAGEAMLQSHEGSRLIAAALWTGVRILAARLGRLAISAFAASPGPHLLP